MAKGQMGSLMTKLSGKIGGQTVGNSQAGMYVKNTGSYKTVSNFKRKNKLAAFQFNAQRWGTISDANALGWNAAALNFPYIDRLGEQKFYTGYQLFTKFNGNLQAIGLPYVSSPPSPVAFDDVGACTVTSGLSTLEVKSSANDSGNFYYMVYMSRCVPRGRRSSKLNYNLIRVIPGAQLFAGRNVFTDYQIIFGDPLTGALIHWKIKQVSIITGQAIDSMASGAVIVV